MIQSTSKIAYSLLDDLPARQRQVLSIIADNGEIPNIEIAKHAKKPINSITGRTRELVQKGLVTMGPRLLTKTGRTAIYWTLTEKGEKLMPKSLWRKLWNV